MGSAIAELHIRSHEVRNGHTPFFPIDFDRYNGFVVEGELFHISPLSVSHFDINLTSFPGKCSAVLYSLMFWLGKWGHKVVKVDDSMDISPLHPQFYQLTIQQKQTLERQIKEGLAGISTAISDFELLFHDLRKYKDFLEYFDKRETALKEKDKKKKEEMLASAEQTLKSIFIDQVDVHTGEGVAIKLIAPRWPTIIADFMRLKEEDTNPKKIAKKYKVSEAEGVVLATKNKLYVDWRNTFEQVVKSRYHRMMGLTKSRKHSIDEYKRMLKPYIERHRSIREVGPSAFSGLSWLRPGAQATSIDTVTLWAFKDLTAAEHGKPTFEAEGGSINILKADFSPSFKDVIKKNIKYLKDNKLNELKLSPTAIEPLDKWVWALYKYIEDFYTERYGFAVRFSLAELLKHRKDFISSPSWGKKTIPYFKCFDCDVLRAIIRLPDGTELEDITYAPMLFFLESYNMMFLRYLEIEAQKKALNQYVNEMLGDTTKGKKIVELSDEYERLFEYPGKTSSENKEEVSAAEDLRAAREISQKRIDRETTEQKARFRFFKKGNYESMFDDRITGPWFTDIGGGFAYPIANFLKAKFDVPGVSFAGIK